MLLIWVFGAVLLQEALGNLSGPEEAGFFGIERVLRRTAV
jgi:hypothetical protein